MLNNVQAAPESFRCDMAADGLSVTLLCEPGAAVDVAEVMKSLRDLKIKGYDDGALIEALEARKLGALTYEVLRGVPPVDEKPPQIKFQVPEGDGEFGSINRIEAGKLIALMISAGAGADGRDVMGNVIAHKKSAAAFKLGRNLKWVKDQLVSTSRGSLRLSDGILSVEPLLDLYSDDGRAVKFDGDLAVRGSLRDGQLIEASGCVLVVGAIEAADVRVAGSVCVKGGVIGKKTGRCVIGGSLSCRFISAAQIMAAGRVEAKSEIVQSQIQCGGALIAAHGPIMGGEVCANGGIVCQTLGSTNSMPTVVEAGTERVRKMLTSRAATEIEAMTARVREVRGKIEPLIKHLKSLTPVQREKVTELLAEASDWESEAEQLTEKFANRLEKLRAEAVPQIEVLQVAYAGVTARLGGFETTLTTAMKGPFKLGLRKLASVTVIVLNDLKSASVIALPTRPITGLEGAATKTASSVSSQRPSGAPPEKRLSA